MATAVTRSVTFALDDDDDAEAEARALRGPTRRGGGATGATGDGGVVIQRDGGGARRSALRLRRRDGAIGAVHSGEDARTRVATIATSTSGALAWFTAAYCDPARGVMFPGRGARARGRGEASMESSSSYDWSGAPFAGTVDDPVEPGVKYVRTLVALEVCERRASGASCGPGGGAGDGVSSEGLTTCAMRIVRTVTSDSGDDKANGQYFVVYAHGNACDVGDCVSEATKIAVGLKAHVIIPEFPGYGVVDGVAHEQNVNAILKATVKYVVKFLHAPQSRIIVLGRSIGTGPATWLARLMSIQGGPPAALILHSPYTSIRAIAKVYVGAASYLLADRWNTERNVVDVACPVLLIHGDLDEIIPHSHSFQLAQTVKDTKARREKEAIAAESPAPEPKPATISLYIQEGRDHNTFDTEQDFLFPIMKFIRTKVNPYVWRNTLIRRAGNIKGASLLSSYENAPEDLEPMGCKTRVEAHLLKRRKPQRGASVEAQSIA